MLLLLNACWVISNNIMTIKNEKYVLKGNFKILEWIAKFLKYKILGVKFTKKNHERILIFFLNKLGGK